MTATLPAASPQAIPVPADFPVHFAPGEERLFWERERTHFPGQVLPLETELITEGVAHGFAHAARRYEMPVRTEVRVHHGYVYAAAAPTSTVPAELGELAVRTKAQLAPVIGRLGELWHGRWLPEIREHVAAMQAIDLIGATAAELLAHYDEARARMRRVWELHFEIVFPSYLAVSEFEELYRELFDAGPFDAYRLLQGFESKTTEIGADLFRLSRRALESPTVTAILESEAAADVPCRLAHSVAGLAFLAALDEHLAAYGNRSQMWGLAWPSFVEDPSALIKIVKDYIGRPDSADPARELERLAAERDKAIAEARARLDGYPAAIVARFEEMLTAAQVGLRLTEDHGFYIDGLAVSCGRRIIMELGRRLAMTGVLDAPDDVLMLLSDEIRAAAEDLIDCEAQMLVESRRGSLRRYAQVEAPLALGTLPPGPPPDSPMARLVSKFGARPAEEPAEPGVIRGAAGSAGKARGTARIVRSLEDAVGLRAGEILVAETTAPPWTPLFAIAAAVVTDTGGVLSHCAVVAREYAIPAVVGTVNATAAIRDGDLVEVDGDAGTVRIVA